MPGPPLFHKGRFLFAVWFSPPSSHPLHQASPLPEGRPLGSE
jgi:hypothetical protein